MYRSIMCWFVLFTSTSILSQCRHAKPESGVKADTVGNSIKLQLNTFLLVDTCRAGGDIFKVYVSSSVFNQQNATTRATVVIGHEPQGNVGRLYGPALADITRRPQAGPQAVAFTFASFIQQGPFDFEYDAGSGRIRLGLSTQPAALACAQRGRL